MPAFARPRVAGSLIAAVLLWVGSNVSVLAQPAAIDCGLTFSRGGELTSDVVCSQPVTWAVILNGMLRLNGFTIDANQSWVAVFCSGFGTSRCGLIGPGTVKGGAGYGVAGSKVRLFDGVVVTENGRGVAAGAVAKVRGSSVTGNFISGVEGGTGAGTAPPPAGGARIVLVDSDVSANSGQGVLARNRLTVKRTSVENNAGAGLECLGKAKVKDSSITGNGTDGVLGKDRLKLVGSDVVGNALDASCGVNVECADIASDALPGLRKSSCGTSRNSATGGSWGVCAGD